MLEACFPASRGLSRRGKNFCLLPRREKPLLAGKRHVGKARRNIKRDFVKHSSHIMKFYFAYLSGPLHRRMLKVNVDGFKTEPRTQSHTLSSQRDHCAEGDHTVIKIIVGKKPLHFCSLTPATST